MPCVNQVVLIGESRKYLSCLLTPKVEFNPITQQATDLLTQGAQMWLKDNGIIATTVNELLDCKKISVFCIHLLFTVSNEIFLWHITLLLQRQFNLKVLNLSLLFIAAENVTMCHKNTINATFSTSAPNLNQLLDDCLSKANSKASSNVHKVKKYKLLSTDFSMPTGELGHTMKLRKHIVYQKYAKQIEEMYQE